MKRISPKIIAVVLLLVMLAGCGNQAVSSSDSSSLISSNPISSIISSLLDPSSAEQSSEAVSSAVSSEVQSKPTGSVTASAPTSNAPASSEPASSKPTSSKPASQAPVSSTQPKPPAQTTINSVQTIINDMTLNHEGIPHGVGIGVDWREKPRVGWGADPHGFTAFTAWGQVYEDVNGNPARNTRVQLRNMESYYLSKSTGKWIKMQDSSRFGGAAYVESFEGDQNIPPNKRDESSNGGGISVTAGGGYNYHFWPEGARADINPNDVAAVYTTVQARLILENKNGTDDRATSRYILSMGGDYWKNATVGWDNFKTNADFAIGRFKYVTNDWQAFNCFAGDAEALKKNPPPIK